MKGKVKKLSKGNFWLSMGKHALVLLSMGMLAVEGHRTRTAIAAGKESQTGLFPEPNVAHIFADLIIKWSHVEFFCVFTALSDVTDIPNSAR